MNTIKVIAVDPGYGSIKICIDRQTVLLPSAVARIKEIGKADIGMKAMSKATTIQHGWYTYAVGEGAWNWGEPLTNRDFSALNSPERMALIFAAIAQILSARRIQQRSLSHRLAGPTLDGHFPKRIGHEWTQNI